MAQSTTEPIPIAPSPAAPVSPPSSTKMSKRESPTATDEQEDPRPSKQPALDEDGKAALLTDILTIEIFGVRPKKIEDCCVHYIVAMRSMPSPQPTKFIEFLRARHPSATMDAISKGWKKVKDYFSNDSMTAHECIKDLMNVNEFVMAFKNAPYMELHEPTAANAPPTTRSTKTRSSGSSGNSNSSGSTLNAVGLAKMREEFSRNYNAFKGEAWILASGIVADQIIAEHIKLLSYESALHSFVIEDVESIIDLFPEDSDKAEVREALGQPLGEGMPSLSPEEMNYLALYDKSPSEMDDFLARGWASVSMSTAGVLPDKGFRRLVHHCVQHLYFIYSKGNFLLPREQSEAWFMNKLWGVISIIFDNETELDHQPGETSSQASGLRRNKGRNFDDRQLLGRKTDGLIVASDTRLEICIIEAAKKDAGATSTKALTDTRKMAKTMKDMHDLVRSRSTQNIRSSFKTFGLRISGPSMTCYSLCQRRGRFYQLCAESTVIFPARWKGSTTTNILSVLAKLLAYRKELSKTADQITEATKVPLKTSSLDTGDFWAATLTTPTNSPRLAPFM
ncbi:hypothetical protein BGX34_008666 [Mortierella sp. NVP85]|nr:hypothetical protein BGX34_008666 [Mortierella sp. NVP85]